MLKWHDIYSIPSHSVTIVSCIVLVSHLDKLVMWHLCHILNLCQGDMALCSIPPHSVTYMSYICTWHLHRVTPMHVYNLCHNNVMLVFMDDVTPWAFVFAVTHIYTPTCDTVVSYFWYTSILIFLLLVLCYDQLN